LDLAEADAEFAGFLAMGAGFLIRENSEIRLIIFINYLVKSGSIPRTDIFGAGVSGASEVRAGYQRTGRMRRARNLSSPRRMRAIWVAAGDCGTEGMGSL
jgi:hypothetical protein